MDITCGFRIHLHLKRRNSNREVRLCCCECRHRGQGGGGSDELLLRAAQGARRPGGGGAQLRHGRVRAQPARQLRREHCWSVGQHPLACRENTASNAVPIFFLLCA